MIINLFTFNVRPQPDPTPFRPIPLVGRCLRMRATSNQVYAWIDEACIDQETWKNYPDIGMAFVYGRSRRNGLLLPTR